MTRLKIIAKGLVRCPKTKRIISVEKPEFVEASSYWYRRLRDGDVVIVKEPAPEKEKTKNSKKEGK